MNAWRGWLTVRWRELVVWCGVPALGLFAGAGRPAPTEIGLFAAGTVMLAAHILLLNDWGGLLRNPAEQSRGATPRPATLMTGAATAVALSVAAFAALAPLLAGLAAAAGLASLLYSHPSLHVKERPIGAMLLHAALGLLQFLLGWLVVAELSAAALGLAGFFAAVLVAGHFVHQCIDLAEDEAGSVRTTAVRIGLQPTLALGIATFAAAHALLLGLTVAGHVPLWIAALFSLPVAAHAWAVVSLRRGWSGSDVALGYRRRYRGLFALSSLLFVVVRLLVG